MNHTRIHDILNQHSHQRPEAEAVIDEGLRLSYGELESRVDATAKALLAAGIGRGDVVATLAPPSLDFWQTYLASASIGALWMGLNPRYKARDYAYLLEDAQPKLVFTRSPYDGRQYDAELQALSSSPRYVTFGDPAGSADPFDRFLDAGASVDDGTLQRARDAVQPQDPAVVVYTSGTTGEPKGALLSQYAIARLAGIHAAWMGAALERTLCPAPINHIGGLNNVCMNVLAYGGTIIFYHRVDALALVRLTVEEEPTYLVSSPTAFRMLLDAPGMDLAAFLKSYQLIVYGGAKTPRSVLAPYRELGISMAAVYGQTESTGIVTRTAVDDSLEVMADTFGKPIQGVTMRVVNPADSRELPRGEIGELQLQADFLMSGYLNRPEATREAFTEDGFLRTGDLCIHRPDGNFEFVDRIKEMFKSGGYNVYPVEIEQAICEHPDVAYAAVLGVPDPKWDEVGHAFVAPKSGASLTPEGLTSFLADRIANFKIPKTIEIVPDMPLLPNSKVDRQTLKARLR